LLSKMPNLESLTLSKINFDETIKAEDLPKNLKKLTLLFVNTTDNNLAILLGNPNLKSLSIRDLYLIDPEIGQSQYTFTNVIVDKIIEAANFQSLEYIKLENQLISGKALQQLAEKAIHLQSLNLINTQLTDLSQDIHFSPSLMKVNLFYNFINPDWSD